MTSCTASALSGACGIENLYNFNSYYGDFNLEVLPKAGSGLYIANFLNRTTSKEVYDILCKKYVLVYQSPVRQNNHSGNYGFFCVFSDKDRM